MLKTKQKAKPKTKKLIYFDSDDLFRYEYYAKLQNISFSEFVRNAVAKESSEPSTSKRKKVSEFKTFKDTNPFVYDKPEDLSKLIDEELYG